MNSPVKDFIRNSKHFCVVPWVMVKWDKDGLVKPCCRMTESFPYGSLEERSFAEIWNGEVIKDLRKTLLEDRPFAPCSVCYDIEAHGQTSFRQEANRDFEDDERFSLTGPDGSLPERFQPLMLDLRLSNLCNFRCRTCNPGESSGWNADAKFFGHESPGVTKLKLTNDELWNLIEPMLPEVRRIYLMGGEPLLIEEHYLLLESLIRANRTNIPLRYNTNLSRLSLKKWDALELWKRFESVHLNISLDGAGEPAELLRKGTDWRELEANFAKLLSKAPQVTYQVYPTISVMNAFHLTAAIDEFIERGWLRRPEQFSVNYLHQPRRFSVRIMNPKERESLREHYESYLGDLAKRISPPLHAAIARELDLILRFLGDVFWPSERNEFRKITFALDRLRKERFVEKFPELFGLLYESD